METIITIVAIILVLFFIISINKKNVPVRLKHAFKNKFPSAKNIDWMKSKKFYEVIFFQDRAEKKARFDSAGNWIETKSLIFPENVPEKIRKRALDKFPDCQFNDVSKIENNRGEVYYKLIVTTDQVNYLVKINESLNIIQTRNLTADKVSKFVYSENPDVKEDKAENL
jgi:uncharacterized membrane protein YkoI